MIPNPLGADSFEGLLDTVINFVFWVGIILAPLMILVAGFFFVTSAGDPKKTGTAKTIILYTAIGLAVILFAKGFAAVLKSILGG
jgi:hypothetical protein